VNGTLSIALPAAVALGATYAVVGAAVAVVAVATRTLHLAVGQVLVAGVLVALVLGSPVTGLPTVVAVAGAIVVGAALSAALGPVVLDRLPPGLPWLLGLVVAAGTVDAVLARGLTAATYRPPALLPLPAIAGLAPEVVVALVLGPVLALGLAGLLVGTRWGRRVRLVGGSPTTASRAGIAPAMVRAQALALGGAAAVVAGLLAAPIAFVGTGQATGFTVRGVAAAALVGRGGPGWALVGGPLLGLAEVAGAMWWPAAGGEVAIALTVIAILAVRGGEHLRAWGRTW
jgi:branched-subunit amino acid ABC-type transport system permease component